MVVRTRLNMVSWDGRENRSGWCFGDDFYILSVIATMKLCLRRFVKVREFLSSLATLTTSIDFPFFQLDPPQVVYSKTISQFRPSGEGMVSYSITFAISLNQKFFID